ncbi:putative transcription factor MYC2-like [Iris pallida]|uniref:Transcription factor MYC2-like n=1 Tax=Iris pallida TaxID=29817 RepID=A0AAX6GSW3_IRIPA|nr:putative transcription factor MYC2-like [Iris pallida]KAJ6831368.1 putative transcription factor MYC2-like [Iris pallida]
MEEHQHLSPLAVTHLLQHTLRSLCIQADNSQWVYAVFWRILPRNYPPPNWDLQGGVYDRTRGNRRNWILVWEDGFCNFVASSCDQAATEPGASSSAASVETGHLVRGLQPELFFKMSHEIYNYGEGLIGKVAADHSHKWVYKEPSDQESTNFLSSWNIPADSQPRTWEAQFQSGIKTIALIAVREGVVQLGSVNKVMEDLSYVILVRKKFAYLDSIPGVLLPHPSSSASGIPTIGFDGCGMPQENWPSPLQMAVASAAAPMETYDQYLLQQQQQQAMSIRPSMSSLEALLSKLPAVAPGEPSPSSLGYYGQTRPAVAYKEEVDQEEYGDSSSMSSYYDVNVSKSAGQGQF